MFYWLYTTDFYYCTYLTVWVSIIGLTIIIRLILYPFIATQLKTSQKCKKYLPHVARLKEVHKNDSKRLQQETMKLYREHGINPAAGCLPMIIQLPIIWGLYNMLYNLVKLSPKAAAIKINSVLYSQACIFPAHGPAVFQYPAWPVPFKDVFPQWVR